MPVSAVLARIERHGVLIDADVLARQSQALAERMLALEQAAYEIAGQPFNLGSPKQIGEILFGKLGLPVKKKTASGAPSTDEDVLAELAADYPLPARILEHRSLSKLKGTYTDKLPQMVNADTGRVHTNYAQAVAVTGRLASNDPNLQNIPIRTPEGRRIREAFVAPPGHVLMSADYSQIELRIMAHISEDPHLLNAFEAGIDVHRATASEVFSVAVADVSAEQRRYAKVINFGLIYGMGAFVTREQPGHRAEGGAGLHRPLLLALRRVSNATWTRPGSRPKRRAMSRRCSAAACGCRRSTAATVRAAPAPSARPSTRRCRAPRPT